MELALFITVPIMARDIAVIFCISIQPVTVGKVISGIVQWGIAIADGILAAVDIMKMWPSIAISKKLTQISMQDRAPKMIEITFSNTWKEMVPGYERSN